jgi:hypothetical protein
MRLLLILLSEDTPVSPDPEFEGRVRTFVTVMAVIALVVMWLWLYFRVKDKQRQSLEQFGESFRASSDDELHDDERRE